MKEHVAQHLGGNHQDGCLTVDRQIAGEQTHRLLTEHRAQLGELLVGQRLDWGRVHAPLVRGQSELHGVMRHHRFARACGRAYEDVAAAAEGLTRFDLKGIQDDPAGAVPIGVVGKKEVGH